MPAPKSSSPASPGITGAIKDAVQAAANYAFPSVSQRKPRIDAATSDNSDDSSNSKLGRMRAAQSTDRDNSYSY